ncbi:hypothetical protein PVAG01_06547 [Phlyctema vagabunda]|uniref:Uncharacterized protein n=1 Tax=Phlyctema vagabunda TaxID=108571 RepID=A0ABR4PHA6_9HELO
MSVSSASKSANIQWAPEISRPSEDDNENLSDEDPEEYKEDWSKTTNDKDSYASRHLRKNIGGLKWKIDSYPAVHAAGPGVEKDRSGSILGVFEVGHEDGVKLPETAAEREEYERKRRASSLGTQIEKIENYPQLQKEYLENRQGSVLSAFNREHQHFDDAIVLPEEPATERRRSNVGIEKIENYPTLSKEDRRDKEGRHGSILAVFDDHGDSSEEAVEPKPKERRPSSVSNRPVIENYPINSHTRTTSNGASGLEVPINDGKNRRGSVTNIKDRRGSVLSLWTDNSDEHEFVTDDKDSDRQSSRSSVGSNRNIPGSKKSRALSGSGQERHGSILSMWAPGKDKDGFDVMHHGEDEDAIIQEEK